MLRRGLVLDLSIAGGMYDLQGSSMQPHQPYEIAWLILNRSGNNIRLPMVVWYVNGPRRLIIKDSTNAVRLSPATSSSTRSILCEARR